MEVITIDDILRKLHEAGVPMKRGTLSQAMNLDRKRQLGTWTKRKTPYGSPPLDVKMVGRTRTVTKESAERWICHQIKKHRGE